MTESRKTPATTWRKFYIRRGDPLDDGICTSYNELGDRCVLPVGHAVDHSPVPLPPEPWRVTDDTLERGRWVKLPSGKRQWQGPTPRDTGPYVLPMPAKDDDA